MSPQTIYILRMSLCLPCEEWTGRKEAGKECRSQGRDAGKRREDGQGVRRSGQSRDLPLTGSPQSLWVEWLQGVGSSSNNGSLVGEAKGAI